MTVPNLPKDKLPPSPSKLRTLVLQYLCDHCYTATAKAFAEESTVREFDPDGDEVMLSSEEFSELSDQVLRNMKLREEIRLHILSGRVENAIEMLNRHFPTVLAITPNPGVSLPRSKTGYGYHKSTEAEHLLLNLHVLAFIEDSRTVPLEYPPAQEEDVLESSSPSTGLHPIEDPASPEKLTGLLQSMNKLYAMVNLLQDPSHKETYRKELGLVGGLLAYKVPEKSELYKYLRQDRREAVADQINAAILARTDSSPISGLEVYTRYTTTLWSVLRELKCKPPPGAVLPPSDNNLDETPEKIEKEEIVPLFTLNRFLESKF